MQVASLPPPKIEKPDRVIEVSRPDPNIFAEHAEKLGQLQGTAGLATMHDLTMRQSAQLHGADIKVMRGRQHSAQELTRSMDNLNGQMGAASRKSCTG